MFYANKNGKLQAITPPTVEEGQVPVGTILHYAGAEAPDGWMICDGRELDSEEYSSLFETIGYTYGGSNSKFKLPDFRETAAVGVGTRSSSVDVYTLGQFKDQQIASHTHAQAAHTHTASAHCHPTAVSHTHTATHCHCLPGGVNWCFRCCQMSSASTNVNYACSFMCDMNASTCVSDANYASTATSSASGVSGSASVTLTGATAVNCNEGASTGTRGRRIALNFIIYTGGGK